MKAYTLIVGVLLAVLSLGPSAWAGPPHPGAPAPGLASGGRYVLTSQLAPAIQPAPDSASALQAGAAGGGSYQLTSLPWRAGAVSSGGAYRLTGPASPRGGKPCCCSYLPCVVRTY
jgi:hypothetical protein